MSDGPHRHGPGRDPPRTDGGTESDDTTAGEDTTGRGAHVAVALTVVLGVVALYAVLGGPLPFVVEGGPSLDAVPAEADAVVYADAWTFRSESSQEIVDGLLAATNRSLPGYAGPVSLGAAAERLQDTRLDPEQLRSVTAFGAYGPAGRPGDYRGVFLKTGWDVEPLLAAFGGSAEAYERRTYEDATVYVHEDPGAEFAWVARLGSEEYALGTERAVTDAVDAHAGRTSGIAGQLRRRFLATGRGPIRFAASMPDSIPGGPIAPTSVTRAVETIQTVAGVYRPEADGATVELSVTARDAAALDAVEPAVRDGIAFARRNVPARTAEMLAAARLTRSDATLTVSLSGPSDTFVDGYGAVLETGLVGLLLGQPVGEPALDLVPADADAVVYADAAAVVDPTTLGLVEAAAGERPRGVDLAALVEWLRESSTLDVTALRSVTLFTRGADGGAVVEAGWNARAVERVLEANEVDYRRRSVDGVAVFDLSTVGASARIAVLDGGHLAVGTPRAVDAMVGVANGSGSALGPPLRPAFERLPRGYAAVVGHVPDGVAALDEVAGGRLADLTMLGGSYDTAGSRVSLQVDMGFETGDAARNAGTALVVGRQLALSQVDNESARDLLRGTTFDRERQVVTGTVEVEPEAVVGTARWLLAETLPLPEIPLLSTGSPGDPPRTRTRTVTALSPGARGRT